MQKQLGQFYTNKNIFKHDEFINWFNNIPKKEKEHILEPFAGSNGIIKMLSKLELVDKYMSFDIAPRDTNVFLRDTLKSFPNDYSVVVTNPPFLAKNSATRHQIQLELENYNDLYEICLSKCLENAKYVAAIIPDSFITNKNFDKSRLYAVISLQQKNIFKDTEHPVCLALFNPEQSVDYKIYRNKEFLGTYSSLKEKEMNILIPDTHSYTVMWNNPQGQIGLEALDATNKFKKMKFTLGQDIDSEEINAFSRLRTRILILDSKNRELSPTKVNILIRELNKFLKNYRNETEDVFLTAFKGLRDDGRYRRRLDFNKARQIVDACLAQI